MLRIGVIIAVFFAVYAQEVDEHEGECPMVNCANACLYGRKVDDRGCRGCECEEPPIDALPCPVPMCAIAPCMYGLRRNERGCEVCECKEEADCVGKMCPDGFACRIVDHLIDGDIMVRRDVCAPIPLCHHHRAMYDRKVQAGEWSPNDHPRPKCTDQGDFEPEVCHHGKCWCVNDRGQKMNHKESSSSSEEKHHHMGSCYMQKSSEMTLNFRLMHQLREVSKAHLVRIREALEQEFRRLLQLESMNIPDINVADTPGSAQVLEVRIVIVHYAEAPVDLASSGHFFEVEVAEGRFEVVYGGKKLKPEPDSLKIDYCYERRHHGRRHHHHHHHHFRAWYVIPLVAVVLGVMVGFLVRFMKRRAAARRAVVASEVPGEKAAYKENLGFAYTIFANEKEKEALGGPEVVVKEGFVTKDQAPMA